MEEKQLLSMLQVWLVSPEWREGGGRGEGGGGREEEGGGRREGGGKKGGRRKGREGKENTRIFVQCILYTYTCTCIYTHVHCTYMYTYTSAQELRKLWFSDRT